MRCLFGCRLLLFVSLLLTSFAALGGNQQNTIPLPDDDSSSRASAAPELRPPVHPAPAAKTRDDDSGAASDSSHWKETVSLSGIKVDFRIVPSLKDVVVKRGPVDVSLNEIASTEMVEGQQAILQLRFTDPAGTPLSGLRLAAWMGHRMGEQRADEKTCHGEIQSFLQQQFSARPEVDLNTYYVLALTEEPAILVIDPRIGFSSSKLYEVVDLAAPGADWLLTPDSRRLFVSMPAAHKVAAIDTLSFRLLANIDSGENPSRLALQPDGKYLWIANDAEKTAESGVILVDATSLAVTARIPTGRGHHEIAFDEAENAYITNQDDGTVSIVSTQKLSKMADVPAGKEPLAVAYSPKSRAIYVASRSDGKITAISSESHKIIGELGSKAGLNALQISPDGRWGFVANGPENKVTVFDTSSNKFKESYAVGRFPDQLAMTAEYIYVRSRESEEVTLIPLAGAGKGGVPATFPAGQAVPGKPAGLLASAVVPSIDGASAFIANPADRRIYYYQEGMAAPMTSFEGYGKAPRAALVLDRSIHETAPGIYSIAFRLPRAGNYDIPLFVESPSLSHCFDFSVKVNPFLKKEKRDALYVQPLTSNLQVPAGEPVHVRFGLVDGTTQKPVSGLKDVEITVLLAEGLRQMRFTAEPQDQGVYQFTFTPPKPGLYYALVQVPSLKVKANQLSYMMIRALDQRTSEKKAGLDTQPAGR
jgi:YVTN family beta-propeller protein